MLANALPVGFSAEELGSGILQPGLESFSQTGVFPAGMPMGRAFAEWLKDLK